jgi:predicted 3-demethylubiquinone-9 3-methyltransferase (glyoxalase superfamily)
MAKIQSSKITPFLWFDGNAEEAMNYYVSVFKNSKVINVNPAKIDTPAVKEGQVLTCTFELEGHEFIALNGGPLYKFNPAVSFFVSCDSQAEVDYYWEKLLEGGKPNACGWLQDKFGVSWQIVPKVLWDLLHDKDAEKSRKVMQAMMKMVKLDTAALQAAYEGA